MSVVIESSASTSEASAGTSHAISLPSGIVAGDQLLAFVSIWDNAPVTGGSGWTLVASKSGGDFGTYIAGRVYTRTATGSDSLSLGTDYATYVSALTYRLSGVGSIDASAGIDGFLRWPDLPSLSPSPSGVERLFFGFFAVAYNSLTAIPSGWSNLHQVSGNIFGRPTCATFRKVSTTGEDPDLVTLAGTSWFVGFTVAVSPPVSIPVEQPVPALALGLALAVPGRLIGQPIPALGLALTVAAPADASAAPSILSGPIAYRLAVGGDPVLMPPMAAIQCQRRRGASTWIAVEVPAADAALRATLRARIGQTLVIVSEDLGVGAASVGLFASAILTDVDLERTPDSATMVLRARVQTPAYTLHTRDLRAVQSSARAGATRTVVCAFDPAVRPGDTIANLGAPWTVRALSYRIDAHSATMTVEGE